MSRARVIVARLRGLFERRRLEREFDDEIRLHLDMQTDANLQAGMSPNEARNAALRSFGGVELTKERHRERRGFSVIESTVQDVLYAVRTLRRRPAFTITSVAVLSLGIGANTAMFSALNAVLFKPLPYPSPEQLAMLWTEAPGQNLREGRSAFWTVEQWRRQTNTFSDLAVFDPVSVTLTNGDEAERVSDFRVSPNFFALLGIRPLRGRIFSPAEAAQRARVAVISERLWKARFGGSPDAIGATIEIDGAASRIVGVVPAIFQFEKAELWEAHTAFPDWEARRESRAAGSWFVLARLRPGAGFEQAQAEMSTIAARLNDQLAAAERNRGVSVVPFSAQVTGPRTRLAVWMLTGAVFCVLLIAVSNVASLWLASNAAREREIAVRAALGAGRARIVRQLMAESLTLAAVSGILALFVGKAGIGLIRSLKPVDVARHGEVELDPRVLGWSFALCLLTGILVGVWPALTLSRRGPGFGGSGGGRTASAGVAARAIRRYLVVSQFALAILLLSGAGLLIRSLWLVEHVDPGFQAQRTLSVQIAAPDFSGPGRRAGFYNRILEEVAALPGVESVGTIGDLFIGGNPEQAVTAEARIAPERLRLRRDEVSANFFKTIGVALRKGRFFSAADGPDSPRVAIVNEAMARRLWPGQEPVGKRFHLGAADSAGTWFTVVGVIGDMRRQELEKEPIPQMFEPVAQNPSRLATLVIRTSGEDSLRMTGAVQAAVRRVDKRAALYGVTTLEERLDGFLAQRRFQVSLLLAFSAIALLLAALGIHGLLQYSVATRTREIGIRIAIGAQAGGIFRMVLGEALKLSLAGLGIGLAGALWLGRAGASLLFGIAPTDVLTLSVVSLLLVAVAAAACYFPARRAMKIDPVLALRHE